MGGTGPPVRHQHPQPLAQRRALDAHHLLALQDLARSLGASHLLPSPAVPRILLSVLSLIHPLLLRSGAPPPPPSPRTGRVVSGRRLLPGAKVQHRPRVAGGARGPRPQPLHGAPHPPGGWRPTVRRRSHSRHYCIYSGRPEEFICTYIPVSSTRRIGVIRPVSALAGHVASERTKTTEESRSRPLRVPVQRLVRRITVELNERLHRRRIDVHDGELRRHLQHRLDIPSDGPRWQ